MGIFFSSIAEFFFSKPEIEFRLSIIGFENAGKTTILNKMKFPDQKVQQDTVPTIGMNVEDISIKNVKLKVWDLSGQSKMRNTWKYYYETVNGLIFVVDSTVSSEQIAEVRDTIHSVFSETRDQAMPILVLANKQDLKEAISAEQLWGELGLESETRRRQIKLQPASARTGQGLDEGFSWIVEKIAESQNQASN